MGNIILLLFCFAAGIVLRGMGRLPENTSAALNAFIINIGLPAVALGYLNKVEIQPALLYAALMPWIMFVVGAAILWPLCRIMKFPRHTTGCVILVGALANTSFIGIPMIEAFYGARWMSVGIVVDQLGSFIVLSILGITVARLFADGPRPNLKDIAHRIVAFPPFIATIAALIIGAMAASNIVTCITGPPTSSNPTYRPRMISGPNTRLYESASVRGRTLPLTSDRRN